MSAEKTYNVTLKCENSTKTFQQPAWSLQDLTQYVIPSKSRVLGVEEVSVSPNNVNMYKVKIYFVDEVIEVMQMGNSATDAMNLAYPSKIRIVNIEETV